MGVATREVGKCRAPPDASPGEGIPALEVAVGGTAPAKVLEVIGSLAVAGSLSATRTHAEEVVMASSEEGTAMAKGSGSVTATGTHAEEVRMAGTVAPLLGSMSGEKGSATAKGSGIAGSLAASLMVSEEKAVVGIGSISTPPTNYSEKCCVCDQPSGVRICGRCTAQLKESLLSVTFDEGCENMFYCLECFDMVQGDHTHREKIIPILKCSGSVFAIVTGGESWASLFGDIQSEPGCLRRLHPPQGDKCELIWYMKTMRPSSGSVLTHSVLIAIVFFVQSNAPHINHKWIAIEMDSQKNSSCILIPSAHFLEEVFKGVKNLATEKTSHTKIRQLRIKDNSPRYFRCKTRIKIGGGQICSLTCALPPTEHKLQEERCSRCMLRIQPGDTHSWTCALRPSD